MLGIWSSSLQAKSRFCSREAELVGSVWLGGDRRDRQVALRRVSREDDRLALGQLQLVHLAVELHPARLAGEALDADELRLAAAALRADEKRAFRAEVVERHVGPRRRHAGEDADRVAPAREDDVLERAGA